MSPQAKRYRIQLRIKSEATFGRGDGIAGLVDQEVEHDENGLPFLRGRTLKGLLHEESDNVLYALNAQGQPMAEWERAHERLFGRPGSRTEDESLVTFSDAQLPEALRAAVAQALLKDDPSVTRTEILEALTRVRRQTAIDERTGAAADGSLRATRVIRTGLPFEATVRVQGELEGRDVALLNACVMALRCAGTARNRGRGRVEAHLVSDGGDERVKEGRALFDEFARLVREGGAA